MSISTSSKHEVLTATCKGDVLRILDSGKSLFISVSACSGVATSEQTVSANTVVLARVMQAATTDDNSIFLLIIGINPLSFVM